MVLCGFLWFFVGFCCDFIGSLCFFSSGFWSESVFGSLDLAAALTATSICPSLGVVF